MWKFWWQLNFSELKCSMILRLKVRASVCVWIVDGKVFHTTEVWKKNEWEYCVMRAGPRMSCRGFLWVWEARDDTNGKRKAERGSGRLSSSWCKRQRLAISLLHRRAGQLSCARRSDFGVCQGARKIRRVTAAWMRSIARATSSDMVPCHSTHLAIHARYISPVSVLSLCQIWGSPVGETLSSFSSLSLHPLFHSGLAYSKVGRT